MLDIHTFRQQFAELTAGWNWEILGFLDANGYVHPIDTDTKVISTVFERLASPVIRTIAASHGYVVELANQTTYPDFTLTLADARGVVHRIAVDVKTTYRSPSMWFTLGGYNSFLRNGTKNILYPYSSYSEHWILGFIYTQNQPYGEYLLGDLPTPDRVTSPYSDVFVFVRKKHEIAGLRAGSGNTKNIGSIKLPTDRAFAEASGPFARFAQGKEASDYYWANYETYIAAINSEAALFAHPHFQRFR